MAFGAITVWADPADPPVQPVGTPDNAAQGENLSPTLRIFHVGDAVHDRDGLEERLEKPLVTRMTDVDKAAADKIVSRLSQLKSLDPTIRFVPAHDRGAWEAIFASEEASVCLNGRGERVSARSCRCGTSSVMP